MYHSTAPAARLAIGLIIAILVISSSGGMAAWEGTEIDSTPLPQPKAVQVSVAIADNPLWGSVVGSYLDTNPPTDGGVENLTESASGWKVRSGVEFIGGTTSVVTLSTPILDLNTSFLIVKGTGDTNGNQNAREVLVRGTITNVNDLTFTRENGGNGAYVSWYLIEALAGQIQVQRGTSQFLGGSAQELVNLSANPLTNSSNAVVFLSTDSDEGGRGEVAAAHVTGVAMNNTWLQLDRLHTPQIVNVDWFVVEFFDKTVIQTGETTFNSLAVVPINEVAANRSWLYATWRLPESGQDEASDVAVRTELLGSPTANSLILSRQTANDIVTVRWFVLDMSAGGVEVQRGTYDSLDDTEFTVDFPISPVDLNRSFSVSTNDCSDCGTSYPRPYWIESIDAPNNLHVERWREGDISDHSWQVIQLPGPSYSLAHIWAIESVPTAVTHTLRVTAATSVGADDDFVVGWSDAADGFYTPLLTVDSAVMSTYSADLPPALTGPIFVRVLDTNQSDAAADSILVDMIRVDSVSFPNVPPVADPIAGGYDTTVALGGDVGLNGSASTDDIGITDYWWNFTDGAPVSLGGVAPAYTWTSTGNVTVTLTVMDTAGLTHSVNFWIDVLPDQPPTADASAGGNNILIPIGTDADLNASLSTDDLGIVNYTWNFSDPGVVILGSVAPSYTWSNLGTFSVNLTVTDVLGQNDTVQFWIEVVSDVAPIADPSTGGANISITNGTDAGLDGSASWDDIWITNYTWSFWNGTANVTLWNVTPGYTWSNVGNFTVNLTVTDGGGLNDSFQFWIEVVPDLPPVANASAGGSNVVIPLNSDAGLNASFSFDDIGIVNYTWNFSDPGVVILGGVTPSYTWTTLGNFSVNLTVTDILGQNDTIQFWLNVTTNLPPLADASAGGANDWTIQGVDVGLNGSASTDDGGIVAYYWNFTDGGSQSLTGVTPAYTWPNVDNITVNLTVMDGGGLTNSTFFWINVTADQPPTANPSAGGFNITIPVGADAGLDGSASSDDVSITAFWWNFTDSGPKSLTVVSPAYAWTNGGNFTVTLTVMDSAGQTDSVTFWVEVVPDLPPSADHTASTDFDTTILTGSDAGLNAGASTDDNGITAYWWNFTDGGVQSLAGVTPAYTWNTPGIFVITLTVADSAGQTAWSVFYLEVVIPIPDAPPTASALAGGHDTAVAAGSDAGLDGSDSSDDVGITNYWWNFTDAGAQSLLLVTPAYIWNNPGIFPVTLTVQDIAGATDSIGFTITVEDRTSPSADASAGGMDISIAAGSDAGLNGSASSDTYGTVVDWSWEFWDGGDQVLSGATPAYSWDTPGVYTVALTVTDEAGNQDVTLFWIAITDQTSPSADASAGGMDLTISPGTDVGLDASASTDDQDVVSWSWSFLDGGPQSLTGQSPLYSWDTPGNYTVTLTVTDAAGNTGITSLWVEVVDLAPLAAVGTDRTVAEDSQMMFDGSASADDVGITNYSWTFADGGAVTLFGSTPTYVFSSPGDYTVTLTVSDVAGQTNSSTHNITVTDQTAPVAVVPIDRAADDGSPLTLDGSTSTDNVGVVNWTWTIDAAVPITLYGEDVSWQAPGPGTYPVSLAVADASGLTGITTFTIEIVDVTPPNVTISAAVTPITGARYLIDITGSDDVAITGYEIEFVIRDALGDSTPVTVTQDPAGPGTLIDIPAAATYLLITVTASDAAGNQATSIQLVIPVHDGLDPLAVATGDGSGDIAEEMSFVAASSTDNIGIVDWAWTILDGGVETILSGASASHAFLAAGEHLVKLTVTDAAGNSAEDSLVVTIVGADSGSVAITTLVFRGPTETAAGTQIVNWTWTIGDDVIRYGSTIPAPAADVGDVTLQTKTAAGDVETLIVHSTGGTGGGGSDQTTSDEGGLLNWWWLLLFLLLPLGLLVGRMMGGRKDDEDTTRPDSIPAAPATPVEAAAAIEAAPPAPRVSTPPPPPPRPASTPPPPPPVIPAPVVPAPSPKATPAPVFCPTCNSGLMEVDGAPYCPFCDKALSEITG